MLVAVEGFIVGFLIAAPVGPIGLLCIRRSLHEGWRLGFATGLGAALADALYAAVAAFGLTAVTSFLQTYGREFQLISIALLVLLALQTLYHAFRAAPSLNATTPSRLVGATATTFLLTLVNPMTVLSFAAAFAIIALHVGP